MHTDSEQKVDLKILACLAGGMLLIAAVAARWLFDTPEHAGFLAALATILLGAPIVWEAAVGLFSKHEHGHSHMDELIALAIIAAFCSGEYLEAGAVAFFMLISNFIEHRTAVGALKSIESLIRITPTKARKLIDGREEDADAATLRPGDVVIVRPGDAIPGDGTVRTGQSTVNQANITGESVPVEKAQGDEVFSGTINETGRLEIEITRAGEDSTLGQVQSLILQAAQTKPVVARMLEKYASYYTPVVLMVAGIVYVFTRDLDRCIALLLVACPCAIVLAGPTAVVAALSASARLGVLIKNVTDLEIAQRITAIVFDKTGTLTVGKLSVARMQPAPGVDGAELLRLAASAEQNSKHPVARAVVDVAQRAKLTLAEPEHFEEVPGRGVIAKFDGERIVVGREAFLQDHGIDVSNLTLGDDEGLSMLFIARGQRAIGWVGLADQVRDSSKGAMDELEALGVRRRVMITGDRPSPARRVASAVHVTDVQSEALPGDKLDLVEALKKQGHTVAVVGDGVNDGPALAAGDISIAMGAAGSDVAIHTATVALMNSNLNRIPFLVKLSRRTVGVIRQNLIGVVIYVVIMLALLAMGFITPLIAAIGHGVSSILVVFNSARLVREGEYLHEGSITEVPTQREAMHTMRQQEPKLNPTPGSAPGSAATPAMA